MGKLLLPLLLVGASFAAEPCLIVEEAQDGWKSLTSPDYPKQFNPNTQCIYRLKLQSSFWLHPAWLHQIWLHPIACNWNISQYRCRCGLIFVMFSFWTNSIRFGCLRRIHIFLKNIHSSNYEHLIMLQQPSDPQSLKSHRKSPFLGERSLDHLIAFGVHDFYEIGLDWIWLYFFKG